MILFFACFYATLVSRLALGLLSIDVCFVPGIMKRPFDLIYVFFLPS